jgi:PAS domain S-box-containing protein
MAFALGAAALALYFYVQARARGRALRKADSRFGLVTDLHASWYWETDAQLHLTVLHGSALAKFGVDPAEVLGKPSKAIFGFELTEITGEAFAQIRAERKPYRNIRARMALPGDRMLYISIDGDPAFAPDGSFAGYRGITREITGQVEAELALKESEERFRRMVETAPQLLFFITNPARNKWIYRSPNWGAIWNYQGKLAPVGRNKVVLDRILSEDRPLYDGRAEAEARGEIVDIEYRFRDPDRGLRWLRTRTIGMPGAGGEVEVYGVTEDVTERHSVMDGIRASEALHRSMLESMAEGLIIRDKEGRIVSANAAAARILGTEVGQMAGRHAPSRPRPSLREDGSVFPVEDYPWKEAIAHSRPVLGTVMGVHHVDGRQVWIRINTVPLVSAEGVAEGCIATFQDITVERAAVRELAEAAASLEQRVAERTAALEKTNRELEAFAHSVSHDLRSPLRAINGFARLLADREGTRLDSESRRLLSRIEAGAGRMGELIDDVIEYSATTRRLPVVASVSLDRLLRSVVARLAQAYPATRFEVEPLGEVRGDARMLEEILGHLVGNALKFSARAADPKVRVWAEGEGNAKTVYVSDNGAGFDMAHAGHLFNLFRRLHHEHEFPGTGVGLATVRNLVEQHGGVVSAQGEPGLGARFSFRLGGRADGSAGK